MKARDRSDGDPGGGRRPDEERLEDLVALYLGRLNDGEGLDRERILADHPDLGKEIIGELEAFIAMTGEGRSGEPPRTLGDFALRRQIGRGGMGVVYEAWENSMSRQVALKVLPSGLAADTKALTRFVREAQVAGKLHHPNVVSVYGMGIREQTPYYAMEYVEGETLAQILARLRTAAGKDEERSTIIQSLSKLFGKGSSSAGDSECEAVQEPQPSGKKSAFGTDDQDIVFYGNMAKAFAGVAEGLQHAHSKGVVHRDIKPSNLILDPGGSLRILDFGLARLEGQESLTKSGSLLGTVLYMSPEQAMARRIPLDHRTDIYSLGATMYEMIALRPPFQGKNHQDTLSQIIFKDPEAPRRRSPRIPRDLETIVLKCLRKDPADRYGTAEALAQDLRRFVRGDPIEARPQSAWEQCARRVRRHKLGILTMLALVSLIALSLWMAHLRGKARYEGALASYGRDVLAAVREMQTGQVTITARKGGVLWVGPRNLFPPGDFKIFEGQVKRDAIERALLRLESIARTVPGRPEAHYYRGRGLLLLGRREEAAWALRASLESEPGFLPAEMLLSELQGKPLTKAEAMAWASRHVDKVWLGPWIQAFYAREEGRWEEAIETYGRLLDCERVNGGSYAGASIEARLGRGSALLELGKYLPASEDFSSVHSDAPEFLEPVLLLAKAYYLEGKKELADEKCRTLHGGADEKDEAAFWIAAVYHSVGDYEKGLEWAERIVDEGTRELLRTFFFTRCNRPKEAVDAGRRAVKLRPEDPLPRVLLVWTFGHGGWNYKLTGEELLELSREAVALLPESAWTQATLGFAYTLNNDFEKSSAACAKAIEIDGENHIGHMFLSWQYYSQGKLAEAENAIRRAIECAPDHYFLHYLLGSFLEAQNKHVSAVKAYSEALRLNPLHYVSGLCDSLIRLGRTEEAAEVLAQRFKKGPIRPYLLQSLDNYLRVRPAFLRENRGLLDAVIGAIDVLEKMESPPAIAIAAEARAVLAESQPGEGNPEKAVRLLEKAIRLPHAARRHEEILQCFRQALLPDMVSYASVDGILESRDPDPEMDLKLLLELPFRENAENVQRYLRGRILERAGDHRGAAMEFSGLAELDPPSPEPHLRLSECLRASGDPRGAAAHLQKVLSAGAVESKDLWNLWAVILLQDLGVPPEKALEGFPVKDPGEGSYAADIKWLLGKLQEGSIRINCGGDDFEGPGGVLWSRDRFFSGGTEGLRALLFQGDVQGTEADELYRTERYFHAADLGAGYRIPLPDGMYRVTLHFAEVYRREPGFRRFGVAIEGEEMLKSFDPCEKGFAVADLHEYRVNITDGVLDIEFILLVENPKISAIEVQIME